MVRHRPARAVRALAAAMLGALTVVLVPAVPAAASVPVVVLEGTGWGHGVGLSQWGAEYLARSGRSAYDILGTFYPGVDLAEATGPIRVVVHRPPTSTTTLTFPQGGEVRSPAEGDQAPGFPVQVGPGGRVRVTFDGAYRVEPLVAAQAGAATRYSSEPCSLPVLCPPTTEPPTTPPTTPPPDDGGGNGGENGGGDGGTAPGGGAPSGGSAPPAGGGAAATGTPPWAVPVSGGVTAVDDRGRSYRGAVQVIADGGFRLVNHVDAEDYLRGMAEVPASWPAAAVQAQTIAARTYALRAVQGGGELCDDARCQVYVGAGAEAPGQDAAVAATAGQVLVHGGALAAAVYSADAGGVSATTAEGFGTPDGVYPYLTNVAYETDNALPWNRSIALADVGSRLGYPGRVTGVRVGRAGPSGRALEVVLEGSGGSVTIEGRRFARALGLRSTRFVAAVGAAATAPEAPPVEEEAIQELPDDAGQAARRPLSPVSEISLDRPAPVEAALAAASIPPALDPRRHPASIVAILLAALVAGALVPVGLAGPVGGMGPLARWRYRVPRG